VEQSLFSANACAGKAEMQSEDAGLLMRSITHIDGRKFRLPPADLIG
jgi:hypothetical protein